MTQVQLSANWHSSVKQWYPLSIMTGLSHYIKQNKFLLQPFCTLLFLSFFLKETVIICFPQPCAHCQLDSSKVFCSANQINHIPLTAYCLTYPWPQKLHPEDGNYNVC
jgi:hypothetical protein